jgi:hypothetical protein
MSNCKEDGSCYKHCACECYDPETDKDNEICRCGCRSHKLKYCRKNPCIYNCELIKCENFDICGISTPKWDTINHPGGVVGLCFECWAYRGKLKKTSEHQECGVCLEDKVVLELSCHSTHKICLECWDKSIHSQKYPSKCPICRKVLGAWKFNLS